MANEIPEPIEEFRKIENETKLDEVHEEALARFKQIVSREEESRIQGIEDLIFIDQEGGTYDDNGIGFLSGEGRTNGGGDGDDPPAPKYHIDRISPIIEEATSDQRESQINIQVRATGEIQSGLSETFNGLIKNIEITSDAQDAYDNAYDECQKSGYGGWQIVTRFAEDSFEQVIAIEPILNATQSLFFGPAKKATKQDALYAFHIWDMDMDEFNVQYPDAQTTEWPTENLTTLNRSWFNNRDNLVRIAAYWRKKPVTKEIVKLTDGRVINADKLEASDGEVLIGPDGQEMRRTVDTYEVERFIMNGVEVLKGAQRWAGKFIPLIPEYGVRSVINGREIIRGKVRKGKDAQRIYDYTSTAIVESAALSAKDFYWITDVQMEGYIDIYEKVNEEKPPFVPYNPDPKASGPPVKATGPTVQQALIDQRTQAKEDIAASVGAGVGVADGTAADTRSGQAIIEGNVNREKGNSIYFNNHIRAVGYTGLILADLIPRIWTGQMQQRIIKPDGTEEFVTVNETVIDPKTLEVMIINDLSQSKFDVTVDVGLAYASQRQRGADQFTKLAAEIPAFAARPDLIAKNLDIPDGVEMHKSIRRDMVLAGSVEPTDEERQEFGIDERAQLTAELEPQLREQILNETNIKLLEAQTAQLQAQAGNFNAASIEKQIKAGQVAADIEQTLESTENTKMDTLLKAIEANSKLQESMIKKLEMGIQPSINEIDNLNSQDDIIEETQQELSPGPNTSQLEEFGV